MEVRKVSSAMGMVEGNLREESMVCQFPHMTNSQGSMWFGRDLFAYSFPVFLAQLIVVFFLTRAIYFLLKPFKQTMLSAQLLAGMIMGQSFMGRDRAYAEKLFPPGGRLTLETIADVGLTFHLFVLGVRIDATMLKKVRTNVALIGISCFMVPYALGGLAVFILPRLMVIDETLQTYMPYVSVMNSITSFPVISSLLMDLNILNSEVGRIATWVSMCCDMCGYVLITLTTSVGIAVRTSQNGPLLLILWTAGFLLVVIYGLRPLLVHIGKRIPPGHAMKEIQFLSIIVIVLLCGLCAESLGQPAGLGTFILGIAVPDGPPLGSGLVQKIEALSTGLLVPAKFAITGMSIDIYSIKGNVQAIILELIILLGYLAKFTGTVIPALLFKVPFWEAVILSLIMCCKGLVEASVYILMKENGTINSEGYTLLLITMMITTGIAKPLVWYLYDPSARYFGYRTSSIMFSDPDDELRMLMCIHKEDNAPTVINLLEASHPMANRPISISVLHLVELQGSTAAMLVPGLPEAQPTHGDRQLDHIANALNNFAYQKQGAVLLEHFTSVAPYASMHDDICTIALDRGANIVIIPFHKQWAIDGKVGASFLSIRMVNRNVLQKAPCSVGVLVDRSQIAGNQSMLSGSSLFRVVMLFLGGSDDCEALAYSSRMADHPHISFTLIWLRSWDDNDYGSNPEQKFDRDMINRFRAANLNHPRFKYIEEMVNDAVGVTKVIRSLDNNNYDLCVVGRHHDPQSPLILGFTEWSECPELGFIGDLLSSSDFRFSVLIVQQQPLGSELLDSGLQLQPVPSRVQRLSSRSYQHPVISEDHSLRSYRSLSGSTR